MGHRGISSDAMAFYLADYEAKYGKMIVEDFTKSKSIFNSLQIPIVLFVTVSIGSMFTFVDFSRHPTLSQISQWWVKGMGILYFVVGGYAIWKLRRFITPHGTCLFEKGVLFSGYWGYDNENNFLSFDEMERIVVAPSRETARRLHVGRLTAGFGQPLSDGYSDWACSAGEVENLTRDSLGKILFVHKQRFFDYDYSSIALKDLVDAPVLIRSLSELAVKNHVPFQQDGYVPQKGEVEPVKYKDIHDCEKEYGRILYPGFTKMPSHLFEGGIIKWAGWPLEPEEFNFIDFRNIEAALVQPSKSTAMKYIERVDRLYFDHAPPDRKAACKMDPLEQEGQALKWENCIVMIFKSKRADTYCEGIKDIIDPKKFIGLLKELGNRHGFSVIDESRLPSGTGEKLRPN